ncbi:hypothetical protein M5689_010751 [Euphorbia peplus]|nr:hypothetical protein M5689_010751 [Euphorbia peplus]
MYDFETPTPGRFQAILANAEDEDGWVAIFKVTMEVLFLGSSVYFLVTLGSGDNNLWMLITGFVLGLNCIFLSIIMRTMSFTPIQVLAGFLMSLGFSMVNRMGHLVGPVFASIICLLRMFLEWRDLKAKKTPYGVHGVVGPQVAQ